MTHSFRSSPIYLDFTDVIDLYRKWCLVLSARFPVVKWRSRSVEFEICAGNRLNSARIVNCLRVFLAALSKVKFIRKASSSLMKEQVSRLTKSAGLISSLISSHLATRVKDWSQGLRRKDWILRSLFLAVTSLCPQKVGSRDEIYWAKWKLMLISDQAKDLVKNCVEGEGSMYTFSTAGLHPGSWINRLDESRKVSMPRCMRRKREFFGVIWRCFARVKCGNIMNGFRNCDCRESHFLCDLSRIYRRRWQTKLGEGKRWNEFAEWHVAWLAEWHNYAECNIWKCAKK